MNLRFEFLGVLQRLAGADSLQLEVPPGSTLADALERLSAARPELRAELDRCAVAQGENLMHRTDLLKADAVLALLPPVAGG